MPDLENILELAKNLGGILTVVFYASIVLWTYKDARRRIDDPILVATAVTTSMLPIVGVLIYMMLRPPEYLDDVRERALEIRAMERQLGRQERCPYCRSHIESNYRSCPVCKSKLRHSCGGCDKPLDPRWVMCPYCETEVVPSNAASITAGRSRGSETTTSRETSRTNGTASSRKASGRGSGSSSSGSGSSPAAGRSKGGGTAGDESGSKRGSSGTKRDGDTGSDDDPIRTEPFSHMAPRPGMPGPSEPRGSMRVPAPKASSGSTATSIPPMPAPSSRPTSPASTTMPTIPTGGHH